MIKKIYLSNNHQIHPYAIYVTGLSHLWNYTSTLNVHINIVKIASKNRINLSNVIYNNVLTQFYMIKWKNFF